MSATGPTGGTPMPEQTHGSRYLEQLETSLRLRDVPQERVDDVLAEIGAHLEASGEDPREAFGEPWVLAAALLDARPAQRRRGEAARMALLGACAFLGPALLLHGGMAVLRGQPATVTLGNVLSILLGLAAAPLCLSLAFAHADGRHPLWQPVAAFTAAVAAFVAGGLAFGVPVLYDGSGWSVAGVGALVGGRRPRPHRGGPAPQGRPGGGPLRRPSDGHPGPPQHRGGDPPRRGDRLPAGPVPRRRPMRAARPVRRGR